MNIFKSSIIVSLGTLFSRLLGFVRDILIAKFLGAGINSDILFIALKIPNSVRQIFGEGAFNLAFIPLFKKYCDDNNVNKKALGFIENTFSFFMLAILVILIIAEIFMPQIISFLAPSLEQKGLDVFNLAVNVSRLVMPYLLFVSYMTFMGAILNSLGKFAAMAFAPAMVNVGYILAFVVYAIINIDIENMAYVPAIGFLFGGLLQFLVMYYSIKKMPFVIKFTKPSLNKATKELWFKFVPTIFGSGIVVINSLVTVFLASSLANGTVSHLFYSERLIQLPVALFGTAIATVLLPTLTQKIKQNLEIRAYFIKILSITTIIAIFCAFYMVNLGEIIVNVLFQRGEFSTEDSLMTFMLLAVAALAMPAIMASKINNVVFYANSNTKLPLKISLISFIINLILAFALVESMGAVGLVIASIIAAYFVIIAQLVMLLIYKYIKIIDVLKIIVISGLFSGVMLCFYNILNIFINRFTLNTDSDIITKIIYLMVVGLVSLLITTLFIGLLKLHKR